MVGLLRPAVRWVPRTASGTVGLAAGVAGLTLGAATEAAGLAAGAASRAAGLAGAGLSRVPVPDRLGELAARTELTDLIGARTHRRVWSREGRAYIELRGRPIARTRVHADLREAAAEAVRRLEGVDWAEVNAVTGEILCSFDEDAVTLDGIVAAIAAVEDRHRVSDETFAVDGHPGDTAPVTAQAIALASDCAAAAVAVAARAARLPRLPRATRVVLVWVDNHPRLRHELEARLGRHTVDLLLAVSTAVLHGLTQEASALSVDALRHGVQLAEMNARRAAWRRWAADLHTAEPPDQAARRAGRPRPLPPGPVETGADRAAIAALAGAAGMLALGRGPGSAADLLLAMVPRAARVGRGAFAAMLGRELARRGVLPLDGGAYRRLDRVTAVAVDSAALCGTEPEIVSASGPEAWRAASRLLTLDPDLLGVPDPDGRRLRRASLAADRAPGHPLGLRLHVLEPDGRALGEVVVGRRLDPLAESVLAAVRDSGARVLLTENVSTAELLPLADDALDPSTPLYEHVRALQRDGEGVLVVTASDQEAALAADVAVGVTAAGGAPVCWGADLLCTGGLEQLWRLAVAIGAARDAGRRAVRLAVGGSTLGALLVLTERRTRSPLNLAPVHSAALIAALGGLVAARRLAARPAPRPLPRVQWHALDPVDAAEQALRLRAATAAETVPADRLPHPLRSARSVKALVEVAVAVRHELSDPLTPVLVLGAAASAVVGSGIDAALVGGVMAGNALISGVQRARAEHALRGLLLGQRAPARRVRTRGGPRAWTFGLNGWAAHDSVPAGELRIGDVIAVGPSEVVPADARLLETEGLEVDEASLTGESLPVSKSVAAVPGADLAERSCMLYEESTVLTGRGYAVVVATGEATQAGRASALAGRAAAPTGVQAQLNELTRTSLPVTALSGGVVSALGLLRGASARQAISSGVAVAVAAVPEGLTLVATVAQLAAARRLSRRGVLVRSSRTLGTLGRADVLCFDKTGTLTEGRLRVTTISGPLRDAAAGGAVSRRVLTAAARACPDGTAAGGVPHATDRAVLDAAAARLGEDRDRDWELLHETPFEPSRGFAAATGREAGEPYVAVKGAPEVVLPRCHRIATGRGAAAGAAPGAAVGSVPLTAARRAAVERLVRRLAGRGLRVLAVAEARPADLHEVEKPAETADLLLIGFLGIADPPRPAAAEAIGTLTAAGIRVVMITGDHPETARAVAARLGVPRPDRTLTGAELDRLSDRERTARIAATSVFARVTPEHKVRIVQALRRAGRVVAMTGDGANDAAAIRLADVGIGLSTGDSRAAPSAADLILRGGDLPGIVAALLEGRALWQSVRNAVSILVGGNAGEVAFTLYGTAVGGRAPLTTRQLLLVNMLTDMMPALAVALAPPDGDGDPAGAETTARPPRRGVLGDPMHDAIVARGVVTALGAVLAWQIGRFTGRSRRAGTMGLAALVITQLAQTLQTGWRSPAVLATCAASLLALAAVIETPVVSEFFGSTPLGPAAWAIVLGAAAAATATSLLGPRLKALAARHGIPGPPS
ncbi:cation-translocating P-type ATPase [Actinomadura vinacea]|uniref:Cation-translocating P-type ATPase n=1 Tax=Actinomadura vinacea TaxID=115336 RepID=A0ABP5W326_9ACTN